MNSPAASFKEYVEALDPEDRACVLRMHSILEANPTLSILPFAEAKAADPRSPAFTSAKTEYDYWLQVSRAWTEWSA